MMSNEITIYNLKKTTYNKHIKLFLFAHNYHYTQKIEEFSPFYQLHVYKKK